MVLPILLCFTWKSNYNATMKYLYENLIWQKYLIPKFMILIYKTLTNLYTGHTNASGQTMLGIFRNPIPSFKSRDHLSSFHSTDAQAYPVTTKFQPLFSTNAVTFYCSAILWFEKNSRCSESRCAVVHLHAVTTDRS